MPARPSSGQKGHHPLQRAGLFSSQPHALLSEAYWDASGLSATNRYDVLDASSAEVTRYAQSVQAYTEAGYREMLEQCSFVGVDQNALLTGDAEAAQTGLFVLMATKALPA